MAEIINLRKARKDRARAEDGKRAEQNRIAFGRTKAEKAHAKAEQALERKRQDGHRLAPVQIPAVSSQDPSE